jgi:glycosyltransferase involved in cell wall biosynthesis
MNTPASSPVPLVSVLVPVCDQAAYVVECLDSIRDEEWPRLELLVLDDGSKDDSLARIKAWVATHRQRFERVWVETQPNQGICKTFNRLVHMAHGEFVTFVASDDTLVRGGICHRFNHLLQHPEHLAVFGNAEFIGSDAKTAGRFVKSHRKSRVAWQQPHLLVRELLLRSNLPGPVLLCRREMFDPKIGVGDYDETLSFEDLDMFLRLMSRQALGFVNQVVACYRLHSTNNSQNKSRRKQTLEDTCRIYARNMSEFRGLNKVIIMFQMWVTARQMRRRPLPHHLLASKGLSLFNKLHQWQLARAAKRSTH